MGLPPFRLKKPRAGGEKNIDKEQENRASHAQKRRSLTISTAAVYAAMYVVLALAFSPISYGPVNLRLANVLVGLVPLIGWPAVLGQTIGVFVANQPALGDPLGPIDLVNVVPSFFFSLVLWKLRDTSVFLGLALYSVALGFTVSYVLNYAAHLPLVVGIPQVTAGIFMATAVLGYLVFRSARKLGVLQRMFPPN